MLKVGLTGGIGSGKTAVSDYFQTLGISVLDTDVIAREVVQAGSDVLRQIQAQFGDDIVDKKGALLRDKLRSIVFTDTLKRQQLETIVHPAIRLQLRQQLSALPASTPYCVIVIPLLMEKSWQTEVDRILVVSAPRELRIQRILSRQAITPQEIQHIMQSQVSDEERIGIADDVLSNDGSIGELQHKIDRLHQQYLLLAKHLRK